MNGLKRSGDWPENLSARARRGSLAEAEQRELERELRNSAALRLSHEVGRDFDALSSVRVGDDALVLRALGSATTSDRRSTARRRRLAAGVGLSALLAAGAAAAFGTMSWTAFSPAAGPTATLAPRLRRVAPALRSAALAQPSPSVLERPSPSVLERPSPSALERPSPSALALRAPIEAGDAPGHAAVRAPAESEALPEDTAADLFRRAGSARSAGDVSLARSLFQKLQQRFPSSDEAHLSHVSLGKLLLAGGSPRAAELQFARYLAAGKGSLTEEAWVGRADSLRQLGRAAEERRAWNTLLERYPSSVYAPRARQRLKQLESPDG